VHQEEPPVLIAGPGRIGIADMQLKFHGGGGLGVLLHSRPDVACQFCEVLRSIGVLAVDARVHDNQLVAGLDRNTSHVCAYLPLHGFQGLQQDEILPLRTRPIVRPEGHLRRLSSHRSIMR
jgi:hypothetical protein